MRKGIITKPMEFMTIREIGNFITLLDLAKVNYELIYKGNLVCIVIEW